MSRKPEPRRSLGRGLSALLGDVQSGPEKETEDAGTGAGTPGRPPAALPIDLIRANPDQPRRHFDQTELEELAASIREHGIIQPLIVRPDPTRAEGYQVVAGERRWRAAQLAGLDTLPVVVKELSDREVLELAIIENIQRADLNPVEEAAGFFQLVEKFSYSQEQLARTVGKSRSHVSNAMRLLNLPEPVREMVRRGELSAGHARALLNVTDPLALARAAVAEGLSVRQIEDRARAIVAKPQKREVPRSGAEKDADTKMLEGDLSAAIGMRCSIEHRGKDGAGELRIVYRSLDDLDKLCQKLSE